MILSNDALSLAGPISRTGRRLAFRFGCSLLAAIFPMPLSGETNDTMEQNPIRLWYGEEQTFPFHAQRWINVLGHVEHPEKIHQLTASLNDGEPKVLNFNADLHRLAKDGDFNAEFSWNDLLDGENEVRIQADHFSKTIRLLVNKTSPAPLPMKVDFQTLERLQDAVQVVDGHWKLTESGVRTMDPFYDRVIALGDVSWKNYDALVNATLHGFTPSKDGPPTYGVTHFGLAVRWQGHHADEFQPMRKWFPFGAQGEFLLKDEMEESHWRILFGLDEDAPPVHAAAPAPIRFNEPFMARAQVRTVGDDQATYRFKIWMASEQEPEDWAVEGAKMGENTTGSFCIVPHHSDITVHRASITPIPQGE